MAVVFSKTSVIGSVLPVDLAKPPVTVPTEPSVVGAGHVNVVPATSGVVVRVKLAAIPLQIDCCNPTVTAGVGFTVTTNVEDAPGQLVGLGPVGVNTYATFIADPVVFISSSDIISEVPVAASLLIPATTALDHSKVEEGTLLVMLYVYVDPLQTESVRSLLITPVGFTVTSKLKSVPGQLVSAGPVGVIS